MGYEKYDIIYGELPAKDGSVQAGKRPAIVIQNNIGNKHSPTALVIPLTRHLKNRWLPTHTVIEKNKENKLESDSMALAEQTTPVNIGKFVKWGRISDRATQKRIFRCYIYAAAYGEDDPDFLEIEKLCERG